MRADLIGVLDDGPDRAAGVPPNPRAALSWQLGESVRVRLAAVSKVSGMPLNFASPGGQQVVLTARVAPLPLATQILLEVVGAPLTPSVPGVVEFVITPAMQRQIQAQSLTRCFYDVFRILADGTRDALVPTSPLYLDASVSKIP